MVGQMRTPRQATEHLWPRDVSRDARPNEQPVTQPHLHEISDTLADLGPVSRFGQQLKKLLAETMLENEIAKEALRKKW